MITKKDVALKILQIGKAGFTTQEDGYKKLDECIALIDKHVTEQLSIQGVLKWVACKDTKPVDGKEYLISDGDDVTEAQWYDDSKWGGEPYDSYTHYAEKPKPPCL